MAQLLRTAVDRPLQAALQFCCKASILHHHIRLARQQHLFDGLAGQPQPVAVEPPEHPAPAVTLTSSAAAPAADTQAEDDRVAEEDAAATGEARQIAANRVVAARERGFRPVVVVSAIGRRGAPYATDTLIGLLREAPTLAPMEQENGS